ncbi:MAG: hypothetical protein MK066_10830 [Crocinitomicaceae bacterium]|nr:hypothetical protein [Crocinitomicaceae bacterium]
MMNIKRISKLILPTLALFALVIFTGCKKPCELAVEDTNTGIIETDVLIYTNAAITGSLLGDYRIDGSSPYASDFEMSLDEGTTKTSVNYSAYTLLANPVTVNCNAAFERQVLRDDAAMSITYKIKVYQCKNAECTQQLNVENWVAVPIFPSSYSVNFVSEVIEK